ncbi:ATP-dependent zinc protease [Candidatus Saccharibacteria bacterium]|nr:ATP-dependent zinc protease [Candidatus Saccharibacteria bacterium]
MLCHNDSKKLDVIGSTERITVAGIKNVPAKIDTGADSSSIWASHIRVTKDGVLRFRLFGEGSPYYTGKDYERTDFKVTVVRSSFGHEQIRYRTHLRTTLGGRTIRVLFNLSDRSNNNYPVLIGRRTISRKFIVDVSKNHTRIRSKSPKTKLAQKYLEKDPYKFHKKYVKNNTNGNIKLEQKGE